MNEEIKEILDRLDFNEWEVDLYRVPITWCELYNIRDYITNLQHENEQLKEKIRKDEIQFQCFDLANECDEKQDKIDMLIKQNEKLKKQKDDVVEYLENMPACLWNEAHKYNYDFDEILRMLGEINELEGDNND